MDPRDYLLGQSGAILQPDSGARIIHFNPHIRYYSCEVTNKLLAPVLASVRKECHTWAQNQYKDKRSRQTQTDAKRADPTRSKIIQEFKHFSANKDTRPVHLLLPSLVMRAHNTIVIRMVKVLRLMPQCLPKPLKLNIISYVPSILGKAVGTDAVDAYVWSCLLCRDESSAQRLRQHMRQNHPEEKTLDVLVVRCEDEDVCANMLSAAVF